MRKLIVMLIATLFFTFVGNVHAEFDAEQYKNVQVKVSKMKVKIKDNINYSSAYVSQLNDLLKEYEATFEYANVYEEKENKEIFKVIKADHEFLETFRWYVINQIEADIYLKGLRNRIAGLSIAGAKEELKELLAQQKAILSYDAFFKKNFPVKKYDEYKKTLVKFTTLKKQLLEIK